jgi:hydrogenase/urease accessory protein HupE
VKSVARLVAVIGALLAGVAAAHRLSPAYFGMTATAADRYAVQWKVSVSGGLADVLEPKIPEGCSVDGVVRSYVVEDARVQLADIVCSGPLANRVFTVAGLEATQTDVLLRIDYIDGSSFTHRLVPDAPSVTIPADPSAWEVAKTYLGLGIEHILLGPDHLLFVLALLLIVRGVRRLVATITAFTAAHSLTLAAATLGLVSVPTAAVEATIALSILFVATELARRTGTDRAPPTLTARFPWVVAFTFGLLHGFGFAGALSEIGLPRGAIPLALLFFNVGVEVGQLVFIGAVVGAGWVVHRAGLTLPRGLPRLAAYVIGSVAAFWVFERTVTAV